jgi:hypothetical protein
MMPRLMDVNVDVVRWRRKFEKACVMSYFLVAAAHGFSVPLKIVLQDPRLR